MLDYLIQHFHSVTKIKNLIDLKSFMFMHEPQHHRLLCHRVKVLDVCSLTYMPTYKKFIKIKILIMKNNGFYKSSLSKKITDKFLFM